MPRTKVSKSSKRNREAAHREEKIRDFDASLHDFLNALDRQTQTYITDLENDLSWLIQRTSTTVLQMKMGDLLELNLAKFTDCVQNTSLMDNVTGSQSTSSLLRSIKSTNPNDEGYLTGDSTGGHSSCTDSGTLAAYTSMSHLRTQQQQQRGRTPGPLSSARARRPRRSRSACGDYVPGSALKPKPTTVLVEKNSNQGSDRTSRSKLRTPLAQRTKFFSADRTQLVMYSPPTAFMRWPKPGEVVLSTCGSPVVAQVLPDKFANVNIPIRNGVLSLRPKKLNDLKPDMIKDIDPETLIQIKTLQASLHMIVQMADKAALK